MWHFVVLVVLAAAIYFSCEWFVNAVEWLGERLRVGRLAVGTVLAAIGTALPESIVTFVAVVGGSGPQAHDIGVGAALGGPLVLATIAYGVIGWMLLDRRRARGTPRRGVSPLAHSRTRGGPEQTQALTAQPAADSGDGEETLGDTGKLARDQTWFLAIFVVKVTLGLVAFAIKPWLGFAFFAVYAAYFWRELRGGGDASDGQGLSPLLLQRRCVRPATWAVTVQTLGSLVVIFVAAQLFVYQIEAIGPMLGLPAAVTALLLSPIATELPETMNAVIWVRKGKTPLALANISGAMMVQATVPSGFGLLFTAWRFDAGLVAAGVVTIAAIIYLLVLLRTGRLGPRTLGLTAGFYAVFVVVLLIFLAGGTITLPGGAA